MATIYEFEEYVARNLPRWPSMKIEYSGEIVECEEVDLYDWGHGYGGKQIRAHYYVPSYGVGNSINKARWLELRDHFGISDKHPSEIKLSERVIGLDLPEWVVEEIKKQESVIYGSTK